MYNYETEKPTLFTDAGQRKFLKVRDHVKFLLRQAGAFTMEKAISTGLGLNWTLMACVDRLVELGEIQEIKQEGVTGQRRVFVEGLNE